MVETKEKIGVSDLVEIQSNITTLESASQIISVGRERALKLKEIISRKSKPVVFNGEQFLEFEDWQTAGQFYGFAVRTKNTAPVEIDGVKGVKAEAELIDRDGHVVGGAEAFCLRDERNWMTKPWFQLASMAQTRAGAKALRNRLSWFVVLAGYKGTPAEEMEEVHRPQVVPTKSAPPRPIPPPAGEK